MNLHRIWHRSSSRRRNHILQVLVDRLRGADSVGVVFRHCRLTSVVIQQLTTQHSSWINTHTAQKVDINELLSSRAIVYTKLRPRCCRLSIRPIGVTFPGWLQATTTSSTITEVPNVLHCPQRRTEPLPRLKRNSITLASSELVRSWNLAYHLAR